MKYTFLTKYLWVYFGMMIFIVLISLSAFMLALTWVVTELLHITIPPTYLILFLVIFVSVSGTAISTFISRIILKPISQLGQAMNQVAAGDFSIQLDQDQSIEEVGKLYGNFNQMVQDLYSIEALRNDFISTVSHEFKTPLSTIRGYVQLLKQENLPKDSQMTYLDRLQEGTSQLSLLTDNILKISKLDHQVGLPDYNSFSLDEQLRQVIVFLQPQWEHKDLDLDIDLQPLQICANEDLLYQVWLNLIDNAIKYSHQQGRIQIQANQNQEMAVVTIADQGIGMDQETQKHIFDRFYQADTSRQTQGNGLGMALVASIIKLHQGSIRVQSQLNHGALIRVSLPLKHTDTEKIRTKGQVPKNSPR